MYVCLYSHGVGVPRRQVTKTALMMAAEADKIDVIKALAQLKANVDTKQVSSRTHAHAHHNKETHKQTNKQIDTQHTL